MPSESILGFPALGPCNPGRRWRSSWCGCSDSMFLWSGQAVVLCLMNFDRKIEFQKIKTTYSWFLIKVANKPKKNVTLPKKGKLVTSKTLTLGGFGTIRLDLNSTIHLAEFLNHPIYCNSHSLSGCFSSTTTACTKYLSVRGSGVWVQARKRLKTVCQLAERFVPEDFGTQVHHWKDYREQCDLFGRKYGTYVTPHLAEHMSGWVLRTWENYLWTSSDISRFFNFPIAILWTDFSLPNR